MENTELKVVKDPSEDDTPEVEGANIITQILGRIRSDADVEGDPQGNSTRWVFDVEHGAAGSIRIQLAFKYVRPKGEMLRSYSFAPLSQSFWGAEVFLEEEVDGEGNETLVLHAQAACLYRVAIDTIHSSTR